MEKNNEPTTEQKIMNKISSEKIKPRSRYFFWIKKIGLRGFLVFFLLLSAIFLSLTIYQSISSDNFHYLSFGFPGWKAFLESLPIIFASITIFFVIAINIIIKKSKLFYQRPFFQISLLIISLIIIIGSILSFYNLGFWLEKRSQEKSIEKFLTKPIFEQTFQARKHGLAGKIVLISREQNRLELETPTEKTIVDFSLVNKPIIQKIRLEDFVLIIGKKNADIFIAEDIKCFNPEKMPMIKRGIKRHFCEQKTHLPLPPDCHNFNQK